MTAPFRLIQRDGINFVERAKDEAFRKALLDGVPAVLRSKMREALAAVPDRTSHAHSLRYFGAELPAIMQQVTPLIMELNRTLSEAFDLPGLFDWLDVTGFGNEYRMIKVFKAWSEMKRSTPAPQPQIIHG